MLAAVEEFYPRTSSICPLGLLLTIILLWGEDMITSLRKCNRGTHWDNLLFCSTIHKLCAKIKSEFAVFYLDDLLYMVTRMLWPSRRRCKNLVYTSTVEKQN